VPQRSRFSQRSSENFRDSRRSATRRAAWESWTRETGWPNAGDRRVLAGVLVEQLAGHVGCGGDTLLLSRRRRCVPPSISPPCLVFRRSRTRPPPPIRPSAWRQALQHPLGRPEATWLRRPLSPRCWRTRRSTSVLGRVAPSDLYFGGGVVRFSCVCGQRVDPSGGAGKPGPSHRTP
jgi:hypothetical protein